MGLRRRVISPAEGKQGFHVGALQHMSTDFSLQVLQRPDGGFGCGFQQRLHRYLYRLLCTHRNGGQLIGLRPDVLILFPVVQRRLRQMAGGSTVQLLQCGEYLPPHDSAGVIPGKVGGVVGIFQPMFRQIGQNFFFG